MAVGQKCEAIPGGRYFSNGCGFSCRSIPATNKHARGRAAAVKVWRPACSGEVVRMPNGESPRLSTKSDRSFLQLHCHKACSSMGAVVQPLSPHRPFIVYFPTAQRIRGADSAEVWSSWWDATFSGLFAESKAYSPPHLKWLSVLKSRCDTKTRSTLSSIGVIGR